MNYTTHIKCDNPECDYVTHFYNQRMYARCRDVIKLNLAVPFNFICRGCGGVVTILKENILKNYKE